MTTRIKESVLGRVVVPFLVLALSAFAAAQTETFAIDARQSTVTFTLGDVLHTVHGTFLLKNGGVLFDPSTGNAGGLLTVDAQSGDSGSAARDRKMHKEILESDKFPEITFAPHHITGQIPREGTAQLTVTGTMVLHGQPHEISIVAPVTVHGEEAVAEMKFLVPYVQWGLKNPSTFILRVSDKVEIDVHAVGELRSTTGQQLVVGRSTSAH
jgi:polyisoprenoid-binding protein YceI